MDRRNRLHPDGVHVVESGTEGLYDVVFSCPKLTYPVAQMVPFPDACDEAVTAAIENHAVAIVHGKPYYVPAPETHAPSAR